MSPLYKLSFLIYHDRWSVYLDLEIKISSRGSIRMKAPGFWCQRMHGLKQPFLHYIARIDFHIISPFRLALLPTGFLSSPARMHIRGRMTMSDIACLHILQLCICLMHVLDIKTLSQSIVHDISFSLSFRMSFRLSCAGRHAAPGKGIGQRSIDHVQTLLVHVTCLHEQTYRTLKQTCLPPLSTWITFTPAIRCLSLPFATFWWQVQNHS